MTPPSPATPVCTKSAWQAWVLRKILTVESGDLSFLPKKKFDRVFFFRVSNATMSGSSWRGVITNVRVTKKKTRVVETVSQSAGMVGGSKLARAAATEMSDALEQAAMERRGAERMSSKPTFNVDGTEMIVTYRPKRKDVTEVYDFVSKEQLIKDVSGTDECLEIDLATYEPHIYYLIRYHFDNVESGMDELGIRQKRRRRARGKN